jgi:hypothetical protein
LWFLILLRILLAAYTQLLTPVLRIVRCVIASFLRAKTVL